MNNDWMSFQYRFGAQRPLLCETGRTLYMSWSNLLDQRRPRATRKAIAQARRAFLDHRAGCQDCRPPEVPQGVVHG